MEIRCARAALSEKSVASRIFETIDSLTMSVAHGRGAMTKPSADMIQACESYARHIGSKSCLIETCCTRTPSFGVKGYIGRSFLGALCNTPVLLS